MRKEGTANLSGYEGWRISSGEQGLDEVGGGGHPSGCRFTCPGWPERKGWWMRGDNQRNGGMIIGCWV